MDGEMEDRGRVMYPLVLENMCWWWKHVSRNCRLMSLLSRRTEFILFSSDLIDCMAEQRVDMSDRVSHLPVPALEPNEWECCERFSWKLKFKWNQLMEGLRPALFWPGFHHVLLHAVTHCERFALQHLSSRRGTDTCRFITQMWLDSSPAGAGLLDLSHKLVKCRKKKEKKS